MSISATRWSKYATAAAISVSLAVLGVRSAVTARGDGLDLTDGMSMANVQKGPLSISVTVSGVITPRYQEVIRKETKGPQTILWIVPEGQFVRKGDLLVHLDTSELEDKLLALEISRIEAEAAKIDARHNLGVAKDRAQELIDKAKLRCRFARSDLKNYREGQYPRDLESVKKQITLAQNDAKRTESELEGSKRLFDQSYITQTELASDKLAALKAELDLEVAKNSATLLTDHTYKRRIARLESEIRQSRLALECTEREAVADIAKAEARLNARTLTYNRKAERYDEIKKRVEASKIFAPRDGMAVYASSGYGHTKHGHGRYNLGPLQEGTVVFMGQELIYLPQGTSLMCKAMVHESDLTKVRVGQPVRVAADALKHETYWGHVTRISPLPDQRTTFKNPDLKRYELSIEFDGSTEGLQIGLNCMGEIVVEEHEDATYIPTQALTRKQGDPTVFVLHDDTVEPREIEIGMSNNTFVHVTSGIEEHEVVLLDPLSEVPVQTIGQ